MAGGKRNVVILNQIIKRVGRLITQCGQLPDPLCHFLDSAEPLRSAVFCVSIESQGNLRLSWAMLRKLSNEIADCHAHAEACARKAAEATTDHERDGYLGLQQHWLTLARSREFTGRLGDFTKENTRRRAEFDRKSASPHEYRLFTYNQDGQIVGPPVAISAPNDDEAIAKAEATITNDLPNPPNETQFVEPWHHAARAVCDVITGISELADILQGHPELRYDLADLEVAQRALGHIVAVVKQRAAR